jgi:hypothetical protein
MMFIDYVYSFYGKGGVYELRKAGKPLTERMIVALLPEMEQKMKAQKWRWGGGDSMDREFFREEVLEAHGYKEGESK